MAKGNYIAGLDIGGSKVTCFIAELDDFYNPRIIGYGQHVSHGMKRGMIIDMDRTETAIREAVAGAEEMADVSISGVYVSLGGVHLRSHMTDGLVVLNQHEITDVDINKVIDVARAKQLEGDRQIIHAQPVRYVLDNHTDIRDPRGMTGSRLESEVHIISAASNAVRNVVRCVERCNLDIEDIVVQPYASAMACLVPDEKELGVCLVDIGGGTCDIAIYAEGVLLYTAVLPVGGNHITSDIARGLSTPISYAERIKNLYGCALASLVAADDNIDIPHVGEDEDAATGHVTRGALAGIIQPRCEEILEMVRDKIEQSGFESVIGRRVVLTGGASQLEGMKQLAEVVLDKNVRLARPVELEGLTDMSSLPQFSTVSGLVVHGAKEYASQQRNRAVTRKFTDLFAHLNKWLKDAFHTG
ncbi:MAG: cell division protein FtsA [bacterium]|jgi:cell division protein FtsA